MAREKKFSSAHCAVGSRPETRAVDGAEVRAAVVFSGGVEATQGVSGAARSGGLDNSAIAASAAASAAVSRSLRWLGTAGGEADSFAVSFAPPPPPPPTPTPFAVAAWAVPTDAPARMRAAADCPRYHISPMASTSASTSPLASERPIGVTRIFNLRWVESVDSAGGRCEACPRVEPLAPVCASRPLKLAGAVARPGTA